MTTVVTPTLAQAVCFVGPNVADTLGQAAGWAAAHDHDDGPTVYLGSSINYDADTNEAIFTLVFQGCTRPDCCAMNA